jgi:hypothetical protein
MIFEVFVILVGAFAVRELFSCIFTQDQEEGGTPQNGVDGGRKGEECPYRPKEPYHKDYARISERPCVYQKRDPEPKLGEGDERNHSREEKKEGEGWRREFIGGMETPQEVGFGVRQVPHCH